MRRMILTAMVVGAITMTTACAPVPAAPPAPAGPTSAELISAAAALDRQFAEAFNKGDVDALMATYWNSPNLVSFGPEGMGTKGFDAVKAEAAGMFKTMPGAKIELVTNNDVHGDVVLGWGTWKMTIPTPAGPQVVEGRFSDVKAMRDGKMVYIMDHASMPPPPQPPAPVKK
jgi:ketosteroid isomerase-like protein